MAQVRLTRTRERAVIAGVCAGIAARYGVDVTLVRLVTVLLAVAGGLGVVLYLAAWLLMPPPEAVAVPAAQVARQNLDDVLQTARRTATSVVTHPRATFDAARRAADDAARAVNDLLQRRPPSVPPPSVAPTSTVATVPARAVAARRGPTTARRSGGFVPPRSPLPPSGPRPPAPPRGL